MQPISIGLEPQTMGLGSRDATAPGKPEQNPALFQSVMAMLAGLAGPFLQLTPEMGSASEEMSKALPEGGTVSVNDSAGGGLSEAVESKAQMSNGFAGLPELLPQQPVQASNDAVTVQGPFSVDAVPVAEQTVAKDKEDGTLSAGAPQGNPPWVVEAEVTGLTPAAGNGEGPMNQGDSAAMGGDTGEEQPSTKASDRSAEEGDLPRVRAGDPPRFGSAVNEAVLDTVQGATVSAVPESSDSKASSPAPPEEQILQQVRISLERGENRATLQLEPRNLGKVQIELRFQNGQLHLSLRAEQGDTGHLLNRELHALRLGLEDQGVKVGDLRVVAGSQKIWDEGSRGQLFHQMKTSISSMGSDVDPRSHQQGTPFFGYGDPGQGNRSPYRHGEPVPVYGAQSPGGQGVESLVPASRLNPGSRTQGLDLYI